MFTTTRESASGTGIVSSHFSESSISWSRFVYGWLSATNVPAPSTPSGVRPWRPWNVFTASTSAPPYVPSAGTAAEAGRSPRSRRIAASAAAPGYESPGESFFTAGSGPGQGFAASSR